MAEKPDENQPAIIEVVNERGQPDMMRPISEKDMFISGQIDVKAFPELGNIDQSVIKSIYSHCTDLNILVVGTTGSGKSSILNALVGSEVFKEGDTLDSCTEHIVPQKTESLNSLRVWDSPGLLDGKNCDSKYLKQIDSILEKFQPGDLILFCIRAEVRFTRGNDDIKAMLKLKRKFGTKFSKNLVIALTHADSISGRAGTKDKKEYYQDRIREFKEKIRDILKTDLKLSHEMAENIQIIPVQHHSGGNTLPDGTRWLSSLWFGCLSSVPNVIGQAKWIDVLRDRIVDTPDPDSEKARHQLVLADEFLPERLLELKTKYQKIGGFLGFLGGPMAVITIPMGIWAGSRYGEQEYLRDLQKAKETAA